jgi:citrate lyase subunit alpha / citrate CoA-transferase
VEGSTLPIRSIHEIKADVEELVGGPPAPPLFTDRPVAILKWVDGTVLDTIWQVAE